MDEKIDLDYILVNHVGQFGRIQLYTLMLIFFPVVFVSFSLDYIFVAASLPTRCSIPECDEINPEYAPSWLLNAVPGNSLTDFDNCNRYVNTTVTDVNIEGSCPAALFDQQGTISCDSYVHARTNSIVYDFGLECREWRRALIGTLSSLGSLISLSYSGIISDRFGRKTALSMCAILFWIFGLSRSLSVNYAMFASLELLQTSLGFGMMTIAYLIATELAGPKYRVPTGITVNSMFATGQVILGLIAWGVPDWRNLIYVIYAPQIILLIPCFLFLNESVRWLISKKKYDKAEDILKKVAKINKKTLPDKVLQELITQESTASNQEQAKLDFREILRSSVMLRRVCTTPIWWMSTTLIYYGLNINSTNLSGNRYLNYVYVSAVEIPGYWTSFFVLDRIGRRVTLFTAFIFCGACQIAFIFIPDSLPALSLVVYLIGKIAISTVFSSLYVYTSELYPTKYRNTLLGFSSMVGRIGSITAPLTPALLQYWSGFPSAIFATMALLSAILALTQPETVGIGLPDTVQDAENIGVKAK